MRKNGKQRNKNNAKIGRGGFIYNFRKIGVLYFGEYINTTRALYLGWVWMGCGSPRYVALQLAHLALTQHPSLQEKPFTQLQELCPELCEEDCRPAL